MTAKCPAKEEARRLGKKTYFTERPCPKGHVAKRSVASGGCCVCARESRMKYYYANGQKALMREYARKRRAEDPAKERQRAVKVLLNSKYGLTEQDYSEMFEAQQGCCAVCGLALVSRLDASRPLYSGRGAPARNIARVDHCHSTGKIRGLLCSDCNLVLGHAKDDVEVLLKATRYLRASRATAAAIDRAQHVNLQAEVEPRKRDLEISSSRESRRSTLSPFLLEG